MIAIEKIIKNASDFEKRSIGKMTLSDRISASREAKAIVLSINEFYKKTKDPSLMTIMKLITRKKQKIDERLKFRYT